MDWSVYPPEAAEDPDTVQSCYDQITSSMQAAVDRLVDEMPHPRVTRLRVGGRPARPVIYTERREHSSDKQSEGRVQISLLANRSRSGNSVSQRYRTASQGRRGSVLSQRR